MDPFKTGPTGLFATALVSLGKSGRFSLGVVPKPTAIANRLVSFDAKGQFTMKKKKKKKLYLTPNRFNQLRDGQKLPKTVYGESVLTQIAKIKMTGSIMGPVGKKIKLKKKLKLPARLLVRPWPDQPDRLLRP